MLYDISLVDENCKESLAEEIRGSDLPDYDVPDYYLWRFMIDADHQGKGFGAHAMELVIEHVKTRPNAIELFLKHQTGDGNAGGLRSHAACATIGP